LLLEREAQQGGRSLGSAYLYGLVPLQSRVYGEHTGAPAAAVS